MIRRPPRSTQSSRRQRQMCIRDRGPDTEFYFAEGSTRDNARDGSFEEWICLQNATSTAAPVRITYYTEQAGTVPQEVVVGPTSRLTVDVNTKLGKDVDASFKVCLLYTSDAAD